MMSSFNDSVYHPRSNDKIWIIIIVYLWFISMGSDKPPSTAVPVSPAPGLLALLLVLLWPLLLLPLLLLPRLLLLLPLLLLPRALSAAPRSSAAAGPLILCSATLWVGFVPALFLVSVIGIILVFGMVLTVIPVVVGPPGAVLDVAGVAALVAPCRVSVRGLVVG